MKVYENYYEAIKVANLLNNCSGIVAVVMLCNEGYKISISKY